MKIFPVCSNHAMCYSLPTLSQIILIISSNITFARASIFLNIWMPAVENVFVYGTKLVRAQYSIFSCPQKLQALQLNRKLPTTQVLQN